MYQYCFAAAISTEFLYFFHHAPHLRTEIIESDLNSRLPALLFVSSAYHLSFFIDKQWQGICIGDMGVRKFAWRTNIQYRVQLRKGKELSNMNFFYSQDRKLVDWVIRCWVIRKNNLRLVFARSPKGD